MASLGVNLLKLYIPLILWVGLGLGLGRRLPQTVPHQLGKGLFWVGVPLGIMAFLHQADLSGALWVAPLAAWSAMIMGIGLGRLWIWGQTYWQRSPPARMNDSSPYPTAPSPESWNSATQGSFLLATMVGNTGYLGYPVILALVGPKYFAWAIFYDSLGSTLGAYRLGVLLAARYGQSAANARGMMRAIAINPALWSFAIGLGARQIPLPPPAEQALMACAWTVIALSLLLLGMRLSQLTSWRSLPPTAVGLSIKMLIVPLLLGMALAPFQLDGPVQLVIVLQMAMPPAFATLVLAETFQLDRDLTVTALALGSVGILALLPVWLWLFG